MAILSIQSHVVYGCAGNSSAVFPLQRLGNEVWAINTVEFSNHTGYGTWRGQVLGADLVSELVTGLEERDVLPRCDAVLSGYLGDSSIGQAIIEAVKKVKSKNPNALYCCDPVMGDYGRGVYVKPAIPEIIKNELVPNADILCPNQFELENLTGIGINSEEDALKAISALHDMGPSIVLVTSFQEKNNSDDKINMLASILYPGSLENTVYKITTPYLPLKNNVAGTGDLTAAVFLSSFLKTGDIEKTLNICTSIVYGILEKSFKLHYNENMNNNQSSNPVELKIIEFQEELASPKNIFNAEKISI